MSEHSPEQERQDVKELAHAWDGRFQERLAEVLQPETIDKEKFFEVLWRDGIIGRLVPENPAEMAARQQLGKAVWLAGKDDPELYWRILYAEGKVNTAIQKNYSIAAGSDNFITPAFTGLQQSVYGHKKLFEQFPTHQMREEGNPYSWLFEQIERQARQELQRLGEPADRPLVPIGAVGTFHGIHVTVDAYMDDGRIWFKGNSSEDHTALYKIMKDGGVSPSEVNPEDFQFPETGV